MSIGFAAGAAKGAARVTDQVMKADMQMIRDQRLNEFRQSEKETDRLFKSYENQLDREHSQDLSDQKFSQQQDLQTQRDEASMARTKEQGKHRSKKVVNPEYDDTGAQTSPGGIADLDTGAFKEFRSQKARAYSTADQIKADYRSGKIDKQTAQRQLRGIGAMPGR